MSLAVSGPCIQMKGVSFGYGQHPLFNRLNVTFPDQQVTAVCGPSGCGKSTLLKLVNGLLLPSEGEVSVLGNLVTHNSLDALRLKIGYAVQRIGLFPHLKVAENIAIVANATDMEQAEQHERIHFLLDMFNLPSLLLKRYPHELSGGQAQRVGLCRALMMKPRLLLLDEAFSAVDPISRFDIYREFIRLQQEEQFSVMLITHDMREARFLADHIMVMESGNILQQGKIESVIAHPSCELVTRLVKEHLLCEA